MKSLDAIRRAIVEVDHDPDDGRRMRLQRPDHLARRARLDDRDAALAQRLDDRGRLDRVTMVADITITDGKTTS